jgi:polyhydroxyalkanoate synthesis regulator phasin
MPPECLKDYEEARRVLPESVRAAAALLRLAVQKLCKELGQKGENLNDDIGNLVKNGLDQRIQQALDIVRVTGNNAVHPGEMNLEDSPEVVEELFKLVNMIVDEMITKPRELADLYKKLPEGAREAVAKRDGVSAKQAGS